MMKLILLAVAIAIVPASAFAAPPRGMYGKHFKMTWTETRSQRMAGETAFRPVSIAYAYTVYVGTEGNVFKRMSVAAGRASGSQDRVGTKPSGNVSANTANFSGNTLIATASFGGAARRIQVTFDGSFSSCSAQVTTAKLASAKSVAVTSIPSGAKIEIESVSAGAASCSVGQGNPFAN